MDYDIMTIEKARMLGIVPPEPMGIVDRPEAREVQAPMSDDEVNCAAGYYYVDQD